MRLIALILAGCLLAGACSLIDDQATLPASGLFVVGGGTLSNPLSDNHCIGLGKAGTTNLLYFSGVYAGTQAIWVSRQIEETTYSHPRLVPGTEGLSNFTVIHSGGKDWLAVQTGNGLYMSVGGDTLKPLTDESSIPQPTLQGIPLCFIQTNANFPRLDPDQDNPLLVYSLNGTNLTAARLGYTASGSVSAHRLIPLPPPKTQLAPGGSYLRAEVLGMERDSLLLARRIPGRGFELILSDLAGGERVLSGFSSPLDDCSPLYSIQEGALYLTSRAFVPDDSRHRLNIFRWKTHLLNEQEAYETGPSSRTWAITLGMSGSEEDIVGMIQLGRREAIIVGQTSVSGNADVFIAALDETGAIKWQQTIGTAEAAERPTGLININHTFYVVGTRTTGNSSTGFILSFNERGTEHSIYEVRPGSGTESALEFNAVTYSGSSDSILISGTLRPTSALPSAVLLNWKINASTLLMTNIQCSGKGLQNLAAIGNNGQEILIGGQSASKPALIKVYKEFSGRVAILYEADQNDGQVQVIRDKMGGWLFAGSLNNGQDGFFGLFGNGPGGFSLSGTPVSDYIDDTHSGAYLAFERNDASISKLVGMDPPNFINSHSWGLTRAIERHPKLILPNPDFGNHYFLTAQTTLRGREKDIFIVKIDERFSPHSVKSGVYDLGSPWTPPTAGRVGFSSDTNTTIRTLPISNLNVTGKWLIQTGKLNVRYWYK